MKLSSCIYLDASFIVEAFEAVQKTPVPIRITKTQDLTAGISAGIFATGASSSESKEFPINTHQMYEKIQSELAGFPRFKIENGKTKDIPDLFWTDGIIGATITGSINGKELVNRESFFGLHSETKPPKILSILVVNDLYFSAGYDQVQKHLAGSCKGFGIGVKGLFKLLAIDEKVGPICAPLILEKTPRINDAL